MMSVRPLLLERLIEYSDSNTYPFHMPGHKRIPRDFPNPYKIDITEVEGFDNLHHPQGILKDSMEWAASVYGAEQTYYLINGSSSGVLGAVCAATNRGGTLLMSRNCHKSAYHAVILNQLKPAYIYPQIIEELGIQGGILPDDVEKKLQEHPEIQAVLVVSPTYDGIVSDIRAIAEAAHRRGIPLIVDEAHGAHFPFGQAEGFPHPALEMGADLVIQSLHKTLPSFTQTAVLHMKSDYIDREKLERYLQMFQSSSPSYLFMAGIEACIWEMTEHGAEQMKIYAKRLEGLRSALGEMKHLTLAGREYCGRYGIYDIDDSKIVISAAGYSVDGAWMAEYLREVHQLEMEMCGADYIVAITSLYDTEEGFERLKTGLLAMDQLLSERNTWDQRPGYEGAGAEERKADMLPSDAAECSYKEVRLEDCAGYISAEFVYLYPPGIPVIVPGERISQKDVEQILKYREIGLPIQGMADYDVRKLRVT